MNEAIKALQAYRLMLKKQEKTGDAFVVARCIEVLRRVK